jgi:hypothetical protein
LGFIASCFLWNYDTFMLTQNNEDMRTLIVVFPVKISENPLTQDSKILIIDSGNLVAKKKTIASCVPEESVER